jgi:hypothetical protein
VEPCSNGVLGRWKGIAINVRDTLTAGNIVLDSLSFRDLIWRERLNFDTLGKDFGDSPLSRPTQAAASFASTVLVDTLRGHGRQQLVPAQFGVRTAGIWRYCMQTTYVGTSQSGGVKWWQGWTAYNVQLT